MTKSKHITIPRSIAAKYSGLTAAVVGSKVVAGGATTMEAIRNAKKKNPRLKDSQIAIMSLPPAKEFGYSKCPANTTTLTHTLS